MSKEKHPLENTLICLKDFKQKLENYNAPPNDEGWSLSNLPGHFWEGLGECINDIEYYLSSQTSTADLVDERKKSEEIFILMQLGNMTITEINTLTEKERFFLSDAFLRHMKDDNERRNRRL